MNDSQEKLKQAYFEELDRLGVADVMLRPHDMVATRCAMKEEGLTEDEMDTVIANSPTTLHEQYDVILKPIQKQVEEDVRLLNGKLDGQLFVGGLPSNTANASVRKIDGGYLVLVNFELVQLLHQIAKIFSLSLDLIGVDLQDGSPPVSAADRLGFSPSGWDKEQAIAAVADVYQCLLAGDVTSASIHPILEGNRRGFHDRLLNYAEYFIVAHEYAHVLRGDCDEPTDSMPGLSQEHLCELARRTELNADQQAVSLLFASIHFSTACTPTLQDARLRAAGIALSMVSRMIYECCRDLPKGMSIVGDELADHPTATFRLIEMRGFMRKRYGCTDYMDVLITWALGVLFPVVGELTDNKDLRCLADEILIASFE